jgi:hypothetical protein
MTTVPPPGGSPLPIAAPSAQQTVQVPATPTSVFRPPVNILDGQKGLAYNVRATIEHYNATVAQNNPQQQLSLTDPGVTVKQKIHRLDPVTWDRKENELVTGTDPGPPPVFTFTIEHEIQIQQANGQTVTLLIPQRWITDIPIPFPGTLEHELAKREVQVAYLAVTQKMVFVRTEGGREHFSPELLALTDKMTKINWLDDVIRSTSPTVFPDRTIANLRLGSLSKMAGRLPIIAVYADNQMRYIHPRRHTPEGATQETHDIFGLEVRNPTLDRLQADMMSCEQHVKAHGQLPPNLDPAQRKILIDEETARCADLLDQLRGIGLSMKPDGKVVITASFDDEVAAGVNAQHALDEALKKADGYQGAAEQFMARCARDGHMISQKIPDFKVNQARINELQKKEKSTRTPAENQELKDRTELSRLLIQRNTARHDAEQLEKRLTSLKGECRQVATRAQEQLSELETAKKTLDKLLENQTPSAATTKVLQALANTSQGLNALQRMIPQFVAHVDNAFPKGTVKQGEIQQEAPATPTGANPPQLPSSSPSVQGAPPQPREQVDIPSSPQPPGDSVREEDYIPPPPYPPPSK